MESLRDDLENEKRESREREQKYMGKIATFRLENDQLKHRNKELENLHRDRAYNRDQEMDR